MFIYVHLTYNTSYSAFVAFTGWHCYWQSSYLRAAVIRVVHLVRLCAAVTRVVNATVPFLDLDAPFIRLGVRAARGDCVGTDSVARVHLGVGVCKYRRNGKEGINNKSE